MKPIFLFAAVVLALFAASFSAWQWRTAQASRRALVEARARYAVVSERIRHAEQLLATRETMGEGAASAGSPSSMARPTPIAVPANYLEKIGEARLNDPSFEALYLSSHRASLAATFAPFYRKLGLSNAQIAIFESAMIKHDEQVEDLKAVIQTQGLAKNDGAADQLSKQVENELKAAIIPVIGEAGIQALENYERALPAVAEGSQILNQASLAGVTLTPDECERLLAVLTNASSHFQNGGPANDVDWDVVVGAAAGILTRDQVDVIKEIVVARQAARQNENRLRKMVRQAPSQ